MSKQAGFEEQDTIYGFCLDVFFFFLDSKLPAEIDTRCIIFLQDDCIHLFFALEEIQ